ncbi:MAG: glycoside hydrolase family 127 protein, partial [Planctomycetes bacterium]|nr:glycoside hydrolase family 127 protein [Planctomycetota bacterium]
AMQAARKAADLICKTYLDTDRRVHQAGSHEMNMGIIHSMARLYRKTGEPRYLAMAQEVLEDFQVVGDYFRLGLEGREFFRTPRPRWESLHSLQGMVELYEITGDEPFRRSFLNYWASIRRFDQRNTGGFSSGERATGNPFRNDAIETCCVVAWQTVMIEALRLSGNSQIADDLELTTLNAVLGSQHPSGAWCTYDTPMNGHRVPSHEAIQFQARADTPQLNCCSVNGPRGYGMLSEWALMQTGDGLVVNYYGPMEARASLANAAPITIRQETDYPVGDAVTLTIDTPQPKRFTLALRIPGWSDATEVLLNGEALPDAKPGSYLRLARRWQAGDRLKLRFDMPLRYVSGDLQQYGRVSLYRGPILLALDDRFTPHNDEPTTIDVSKLDRAELVSVDEAIAKTAGRCPPWLVVDLPAGDGKTVRLIDFASAGATGGEYRTWLPASGTRPPTPVAWQPAHGSKIGPGPIRFSWRAPAADAAEHLEHSIVLSESPTFDRVSLPPGDLSAASFVLSAEEVAKLAPDRPYYWKVVVRGEFGQSESIAPYKRFEIDPTAPPMPENPYGERKHDRMLTAAPLSGNVTPEYGELVAAEGWTPATGPGDRPDTAVELDGKNMLKYKLVHFPEEEYTVSIWVAVTRFPESRYGQVFSAWCAGGDDPLRLVVQEGKLFARIEAGGGWGTEGVELEPSRWYHVVGVKNREKLTLHVDGQARSSAKAPRLVWSGAGDFAVGGNPNYRGGPEFLPARFADLRFYARALSPEEVNELHRAGCGKR